MSKSKIKKYTLILVCAFFTYFGYFAYAQQTISSAKDSDKDGLTDIEEIAYGTDPNNIDTDGDSYSDGVEIKSGYDPLKPAPGDKIIKQGKSDANTKSSDGDKVLTDNFAQSIKGFLETKDNQSISVTELDSFINENFSAQMQDLPSFDNLPEIDRSRLKIKKQPYANLTQEEKKKNEANDTKEYLLKLLTLFYYNLPNGAISNNDISTLYDNIQNKLATLGTATPDYAFFRDFSDKMNSAMEQSYEIEIPEQLLEDHIKILRITQSYLQLKEDQTIGSIEDPLSQMIILTRARNLMGFTQSFLIDETQKVLNIAAAQ